MTISFITTVYNEEDTIDAFLESLFAQTTTPDEVIIVDGGSTDKTVARIRKTFALYQKLPCISLVKKGNRAVGRNEAVRRAKGNIIVCSDAGNILDKKWMQNITRPFREKDVDVVAGYYKGLAKTVFQKCLIPFALVMPDKVNPTTFLPATRSIAFSKQIWRSVGGFDERLSHNEDYDFARKLKKYGARIVFAKDALVYWLPRSTFKEAFIMMFRFAYGDAQAGIFRPKVFILYTRYIIGIFLVILAIIVHELAFLLGVIVLFLFYLVWAGRKNYRYVKKWQAIIILPALQLIADAAVISGTLAGLLQRTARRDIYAYR